jgi:hypothetical protein
MSVNKVIFGTTVLVDLTEDTITPDVLLEGYTAHAKDGTEITGTMPRILLTPYVYDFNQGYVDNGNWKREIPTRTYCDIYKVKQGCSYFITLGENVGTRFRVMFTTNDVSVNNVNTSGTRIVNINSPASYQNVNTAVMSEDGYIIVAKDNVGKSGIYTYMYEFNIEDLV